MRDDSPWDAECFRLKNIWIHRTVSRKIKKTRSCPVRPLWSSYPSNIILPLTVGDKNLSVGKYDIKIYVGTKDKFPPPRQMWHKILCRNKRQICLGKYDNIIPFLFKHRLPCLITLHTDSIFQFFIPYRCTKVLR